MNVLCKHSFDISQTQTYFRSNVKQSLIYILNKEITFKTQTNMGKTITKYVYGTVYVYVFILTKILILNKDIIL
jgi:hypothetical protein